MKSDFVCSICFKILKNPISFLCGCTVCGDHLHDKEVLATSKIECKKFHIAYSVKESASIKPNKALANLLKQGMHLSCEEKSLKLNTEQALSELNSICEEFREKSNLLDVEVCDYLVELRRKIEIRREEAKERIDALFMEITDLTKQVEAHCRDLLKKQAKNALERNGDDWLEAERTRLDEEFRDPKLNINNVKAIKTKHENKIAELREKLGNLVKSHEFKSGVSSKLIS